MITDDNYAPYRWSGSAWTLVHDATPIVASQIAAGIITADKMAANTLTVNQLQVGTINDNLFPNGTSEVLEAGAARMAGDGFLQFADGTRAHDLVNCYDPVRGFVYDTQYWPSPGVNWGWGGSRYVRARRTAVVDPLGGSQYHELPTVKVPAQQGDYFSVSAQVRMVAASPSLGGAYVGVRFYDAAGTSVGDFLNMGYTVNAWGLRVASGVAPANTAYAGALFGVDNGVANSDGACAFFDSLEFHRDVKTSNYAEDGSGNPTAGAKLSSGGTALKVAPGNLQLGDYFLSSVGRAAVVCMVQVVPTANFYPTVTKGNVTSVTRIDRGAGYVPRYVLRVAHDNVIGTVMVAPGWAVDTTHTAVMPHFIVSTSAANYTDIGFLNFSSWAWDDPNTMGSAFFTLVKYSSY